MNFFITPEEALKLMLLNSHLLGSERIHLSEGLGRILAQDIISDKNIPDQNNSAMDGFALFHEDTRSATELSPAILTISGEVRAAPLQTESAVKKGEAVRIMTGSVIPEGADSIVPVEEIVEQNGCVKISRPVKKHDHVRFVGEDIKKSETVFLRGRKLNPADMGLLASLGYMEIEVSKKPLVAILATGDEVVEADKECGPGQVRNSNSWLLRAEIMKCGVQYNYLGIVPDQKDLLREKLLNALECDIVITTGGVSMGKYDLVKEIVQELGVEIFIEKIRMKPGRPLIFGKKGPCLFFGLPGNPVSTQVAFLQFVRPVIFKMMSAEHIFKPVIKAVLDGEITIKTGRKQYLRGIFTIEEGDFHVRSTGPQGSGILKSMSKANCLIILDGEQAVYMPGDRVCIQLIDHEEI